MQQYLLLASHPGDEPIVTQKGMKMIKGKHPAGDADQVQKIDEPGHLSVTAGTGEIAEPESMPSATPPHRTSSNQSETENCTSSPWRNLLWWQMSRKFTLIHPGKNRCRKKNRPIHSTLTTQLSI